MVDEFGSNITLKLSDFRLAKKTTAHKYISNKEECQNVAVRWTAPEVRQINHNRNCSVFWCILQDYSNSY